MYICGPRGLIDAAKIASNHWPKGTVHYELFSSLENNDSKLNNAFKIKITSRNLILNVPRNKSILKVIKEAGIDIDFSCESGVCGSCKVGLLSGNADHKDNVLSNSEKLAQSNIMICVSRAKSGTTLVLDL